MSFLLTFFAILAGLVFSNFRSAQIKAADTERKTDINAIHSFLEKYFAENSYYPTAQAFESQAAQLFPGLDEQALMDPNGAKFNAAGDYSYIPSQCSNNECQGYTLTAILDSNEPYVKNSLN